MAQVRVRLFKSSFVRCRMPLMAPHWSGDARGGPDVEVHGRHVDRRGHARADAPTRCGGGAAQEEAEARALCQRRKLRLNQCLGWKDPFASAAATARQRANSRAYERGEYYEEMSEAHVFGSRSWWLLKEREMGGSRN